MLGSIRFKLKKWFGATDLTRGGVRKVIFAFSLPIMFSYLLQQLYTVADAAICGQTLGVEQVAGINDTYAISFLFLQFAFGCTAGFSVILSNKTGENDRAGARRSFAAQIVLSAATCAVLTAVALALIGPLLALVGLSPEGSASNRAVYDAAYTYIFIISAGIAAQFFYNFICCVLRAIGDSFTPLVFLVISTALNVGLDVLFISAFGMGVAGAAWATVISQAVAAAGCFAYTFYRYKYLRLSKEDFKFTFEFALDHIRQGIPLGFQFSVLSLGILAVSNVVVAFDKTAAGAIVAGTPAENGFGAANKVVNFLMTPFNALGTAMISFCGQNAGAEKFDRVKSGIIQAHIIMLIEYAVVAAAGLLLTIDGAYLYLFLSPDKINAQTIEYGNMLLYADMPTFFLLGILLIGRNSLNGAGAWLYPFLAGFAELACRVVISFTVPQAVAGGAVNADSSIFAFLALCFSDAGAWIGANAILVTATLKLVFTDKGTARLKAIAERKRNGGAKAVK